MAAPGTVTFTMRDSGPTTVALAIPSNNTASQFIRAFQLAGGLWDKPATADSIAGATWWPWVMVSKAVTS